jgi:hypothetical protein
MFSLQLLALSTGIVRGGLREIGDELTFLRAKHAHDAHNFSIGSHDVTFTRGNTPPLKLEIGKVPRAVDLVSMIRKIRPAGDENNKMVSLK